jgi:rare lipoprotein A
MMEWFLLRRVSLSLNGLVLAFFLVPACAGTGTVHPPPSDISPAPSIIPAPDVIYREIGTAAWYGKELHGKPAANGEILDMQGFTAAHRTLPLGTIIRVTNLDNFKSIKVRITDRGPFIRSRVLDLSYGAARELGFIAQGTARVKIDTLEPVHTASFYTVQAASFAEEDNARMLKERLTKKFEVVTIVPVEAGLVKIYSVRVGSYASEERAELVAGKLTLEGLEPLVMRKD